MNFIRNMKESLFHVQMVDLQCVFNNFEKMNIDAANEI